MGLAYDPFSSGVTERDLAPDFGKVYVDLLPSLLQDLQRPATSIVLGNYGMGKTAARLGLEFALRHARTPRTLCVTYAPQIDRLAAGGPCQAEPDDGADRDRLAAHLRAITQEASVDLVVQLVERAPGQRPEAAGPQDRLRRQARQRQGRAAGPVLGHRMRRALRSEEEDGIFWRGVRAVVRHVARDDPWRSLVQDLVFPADAPPDRPATLEELLFDARALGFEQIFVLIDAVDDGAIEPERYFAAIQPLLAVAGELQAQHLYLKCFLPLAMKPQLEALLRSALAALTPRIKLATIDAISDANLHRLIDERIVAANTSTEGVFQLDRFGERLEVSVQERLISAAAGSPRRLIELVNALLDFHSLHGFRDGGRLWLTAAEWKRFEEVVAGSHTPPV